MHAYESKLTGSGGTLGGKIVACRFFFFFGEFNGVVGNVGRVGSIDLHGRGVIGGMGKYVF